MTRYNELVSKVRVHHEFIKKHLETIFGEEKLCFSTLIGSQNYEIDTPKSDIDTCTFIFPTYQTLVLNKPAQRYELEVEDGKCVIMDIREGFRLLRKPSPNSIEWFISPYRVVEPEYESIVHEYLDNNQWLYDITHADFHNFLMACYGCAKGLHSRNMPGYKKFGHALRMLEMQKRYINPELAPIDYLGLRPGDRDLIRDLKNGISMPYHTDEYFEEQIEEIAGACKIVAEEFDYKALSIGSAEATSSYVIDAFQYELFDKYLAEVMRERTTNHI